MKIVRRLAIGVAALGVALSLVPAGASVPGTCGEDDNCYCPSVYVAHVDGRHRTVSIEKQEICLAVPDPIP